MTMAKFKPFFNSIVSSLAEKHRVYTSLIKTNAHGPPQARVRTYVVAILRSNLRMAFTFPTPLLRTVPLSAILKGEQVSTAQHMLPPKGRTRDLVQKELTRLVKAQVQVSSSRC